MAANSPACSLIQASMAGAGSTLPLNRSNSVLIVATLESAGGVLSWRLERYLLVPGCHTFLILHGIAETFGLHAELAKSVQGHQSAMRVECHDMGEDAAEREGLSRFAQSVDKRIVPGGAVSDVPENTMQFSIGLFESLQHRLRGTLRLGRAVHIHIGSGQRGGPDFFREDNVFQKLPQGLIRLPPGQHF